MIRLTYRDLVFLFVGLLISLLAFALYWQLNKQTILKSQFRTVAVDKSCVVEAEDLKAIEKEDEEIYFVGCGGFF